MTVGALDDEIARAREAIRTLRHAPHGETVEQARARSCQIVALSNKLIEVSREVVNVVAKPAVEPRRSPTGKTERRAIIGELRAQGRRLVGYAATFGSEAKISDFIEVIARGAFAGSLNEKDDILAL